MRHLLWITVLVATTGVSATASEGGLVMDSIRDGSWRFDGVLGERIDANVENWLLRAPDTNPGLIEMFHRRDRHLPYDEPVPWAGEFAGKYLISAVQALRMTGDERLQADLTGFVDALVASQAEDGYLGPWREDERLLGHWDLWGHYHCMLGLLMWFDATNDTKAFECTKRAADCICDIYVAGGRRPIEAGTPQINLAVLHVIGDLYRRTGEEPYLELMRRIEADMEQDGDWRRKGEEGVPYYKLPGGGTRWESLHIVQGLVELYRITGEERYKKAVVSLWESIRTFDRHPSGAFSTHEQAFGSVYEEGSIETCCSVAWEALTVDMLRLTGDPRVADELELTTWNQVLAAQHPSGSWWTYDTPMNGLRIPSFHHIRFQARPGTPELNCCSVNAPRGLGMLSEWAVMEDGEGLIVNFYGPGAFTVNRRNGETVTLTQTTEYPLSGKISLTLGLAKNSAFTLKFRVPEWSRIANISVNGAWHGPVTSPGTYQGIGGLWTDGDRVELDLDLPVRHWPGEDGRHGRSAVYAGPLLLAFDAFHNSVEVADLPPIDVANLAIEPVAGSTERRPGQFPPIGLWRATTADGGHVVLCDFASAGAHGTEYVTWLPVSPVKPPRAKLHVPQDGAVGRSGPILFRWDCSASTACTFELVVARDSAFSDVVVRKPEITGNYVTIQDGLSGEGEYFWKTLSVNEEGAAENRDGPRSFGVDETAADPFFSLGEHGLLAASSLDGDGAPSFGILSHQRNIEPAPDRFGNPGKAVAFNGRDSEIRYRLPFFPDRDYSFHAWVCPEGLPVSGLGQVFSAWCRGTDDPLRVTVEGSTLSARIEAGSFQTTERVPIENGKWIHVAAVKQGPILTLYVDGKPAHSVEVPERVVSSSTELGIGFNPLFSGGEHFQGKITDFAFYAEALSPEGITSMYEAGKP